MVATSSAEYRANRGYHASASMARVLVIDDDSTFLPEQVRHAFPGPDYQVTIVGTGREGIGQVQKSAPDVILLDLRLPDQSGLLVYAQIREIDARIPVIFITSAASADTAIEAMRQGAFNYLHKPLDLQELQDVVREAIEVTARMRMPIVVTRAADDGADGSFIASSKSMLEACKAIGRVSGQEVPVLITGESGTGKELVARAIYQHSGRALAPFLALNCAAIPENLLESELFGHEKGAFTGADRRRIGKFEQCSGGTILLDEIGDMPLPLQAKILRLLQEQNFQRIGGEDTVQTDVRVIAATHRDLRALAAEGKFRQDLYYRLAVCTIDLPPLRAREGDLPILVRHFLGRYNRDFSKQVSEIDPEAMTLLSEYTWPGNIRELQSVIKQVLLRAKGNTLSADLLSDLLSERGRSIEEAPTLNLDAFISGRLTSDSKDLYSETRREVDRLLLTRVLEHTSGNHREAARILGVARQTMRVRLKSLGLQVSLVVSGTDDDD